MTLTILQAISATLLVVAILLQSKGTGLGAAFGGGGSLYRTEKRGAEKVLFRATLLFAALFFGLLVVDIFTA